MLAQPEYTNYLHYNNLISMLRFASLLYLILSSSIILTAQDYRQFGGDLIGLADGGKFGHDVAISGDGQTIVVSSVLENSNAGAVRVYRTSGGAFTQLGETIAGTANNTLYGRSVAISNDGTRFAFGTAERLLRGG